METGGRWLGVREAAIALDLSERTVRRYLRAGVYRGRLVKGVTEVWLPEGVQAGHPNGAAPAGGDPVRGRRS